MLKESINTSSAPGAIGPYSQAIKFDKFIYTSGQIPFNSEGELVGEEIKAQTAQCLLNIRNILEAAGSSLEKAIKTTVFLSDMENFADMNEIYARFFSEPFPARSCIQAARLPKDVLVEIEVVASL